MAKNILIVSETNLEVDGRSLRFAQAFASAGHRVIGAGFGKDGAAQSTPSEFHKFIFVPIPRTSRFRRYWLPVSLLFGKFIRPLSPFSYWLHPHRHVLYRKILEQAKNPKNKPAIVIAKHWSAGLIGLAVARKFDVPFIYDANELSFAEHEHNKHWRLLARPVIKALDESLFEKAAVVTTIGEGLADIFATEYALLTTPTIIRNIPNSPNLEPRRCTNKIRFIYIGLAHPIRNLENIITSVSDWHIDRTLILQLTGDPNYITSLRYLTKDLNLEHKIEFRAPVADADIVESLAEADIGLCTLPTFSRQLQFSEPNKLYQYLKGGLPILASQLPRLGQILSAYKCGWSMPCETPKQISKAVNSLSISDIHETQEGVVKIQNTLYWSNEAERLNELVNSVHTGNPDPKNSNNTR